MDAGNVSRPRTYWDDGADLGKGDRTSVQVHEPPDDHLQDTGLLDKDGNPLMRKVERRPIGFLHAYPERTP